MKPKQREKLIWNMAKAIYRVQGGDTEYPWNISPNAPYKHGWQTILEELERKAKAALDVAEPAIRDDVLCEVNYKLAAMSVEIEVAPYSCGPQKWCEAVNQMKVTTNEKQ